MNAQLLIIGVVLNAVCALNNGLARTPPMGYNTWFDMNGGPSDDGTLRATADAMVSTGLLAAGYNTITVDDLWSNGRDAQKNWIPIAANFPNGLQPLFEYIRSKGFYIGMYTDRGTNFCGGPNGTGSQGYEAHDAGYFAAMKADFVKEDSCNAPDDHATAYHQYALMRDGLNSTGRPIVFSLCGWNPWYAPEGMALGNMWRIGPDAATWGNILTNIDFDAPLWPYAGPGGWNDPDILGAGIWGPITSLQKRAQFTVYALLAAPLILSVNVRNLSAYDLETYSNPEVIGINQDPLGRQAQRLLGGDLSRSSDRLRLRRTPWARGEAVALDGPAVALQPCTVNSSDPSGALLLAQQWQWNATQADGTVRSLAPAADPAGACLNVDACGTAVIGAPCHTQPGSGFSYGAGFLPAGNDLSSGNYSLAAAQALCLANEYCAGITFASASPDCNSTSGGTCNVYFKSSAAGLTPGDGWQTYSVTWPAGMARPFARATAEAIGTAPPRDWAKLTRFYPDAGSTSTCPACPDGTFCNVQWYPAPDGTVRSAMSGGTVCLSSSGEVGSALAAVPCVPGDPAQQWQVSTSDGSIRPASAHAMCATLDGEAAVGVWGKPLANGAFALAAMNVSPSFTAFNTTCDFATCLGPATGWDADQTLSVRDVWARADVANITAGQGWTVPSLTAGGGVAAVVLAPYW